MATLLIVRHGQASALTGDYDQLSTLGGQQAAALGRWLADRRRTFSRVYVGPRRRHQQTLDAVAAAYRDTGLTLPEAELLESLDETDGPLALARNLPAMAEHSALVRDALAAAGSASSPREWLRMLKTLVHVWSRGELAAPDLPSWSAFRETVGTALARMTDGLPRGEQAIAFTSAGTTAAAIAAVLNLDDERAVDLMFTVRNASVSAIRVSRDRLSLASFNELPHLDDEAMHTLV